MATEDFLKLDTLAEVTDYLSPMSSLKIKLYLAFLAERKRIKGQTRQAGK